MSEIIQLYKNKTTKVYPKTLASEVYIDSNNNILSKFNEVNESLDNKVSYIMNINNKYIYNFPIITFVDDE